MNNFSKTKHFVVVIVLVVVAFAGGMYFGVHKAKFSSASSDIGSPELTVDLSDFWKVWKTIDEKYPDADKVTAQERMYGAISGLLESLDDPYSVFFKPEEAKSFQEDISGTFTGVGMEVGLKNKVLTVIAPLKDTPAYKAGIKPGDRILKIDETPTSGFTVDQAVKLIRGERGSTVSLTIYRDGDEEPREIKIVRDTINIPTLETEMRADGVFVVRLFSFTANSPTLFRNAMKEFVKAKTDKMVLDLRGNPGGYLEAAVSISSWFLPEGETIVTEDKGNDEKPTVFRSRGYDDALGKDVRLVILMDGGSASASEIVAGALRDHKKALLVGTKSYGKGSVQEVVDLAHDTILKITIAKWLTPNGTSISLKGLEPDYVVELNKDSSTTNDSQLNKAAELLKNWPGIK